MREAKSQRRRLAAMAVIAAGLAAIEGRARASVEAVHLVYEAASDCPARAEFVAGVLARTQKAILVDASQADRTFVVTLDQVGSAFAGRLAIHKGGETTTRDVKGPTCAAVTSALALVAALAIDPASLQSAPRPTAETAASQPPPPPPASSPHEPAPTIPPGASSTTVSGPTAAPAGDSWRWRLGARAEVGAFVAPHAALGAGAFLELARPESWRLAEPGTHGSGLGVWTLRVGAHYAATGQIERDVGAAHFNWAAVRLESCLLRLRFAASASLDACAAFDLGAIHGVGEVAESQPSTTPWISAGPVIRVPWFFAGSWFLEAEGALVVPLRRETFIFGPQRVVFYEVPPAGPAAALGVGYGFR
jgi:hypothetical protein